MCWLGPRGGARGHPQAGRRGEGGGVRDCAASAGARGGPRDAGRAGRARVDPRRGAGPGVGAAATRLALRRPCRGRVSGRRGRPPQAAAPLVCWIRPAGRAQRGTPRPERQRPRGGVLDCARVAGSREHTPGATSVTPRRAPAGPESTHAAATIEERNRIVSPRSPGDRHRTPRRPAPHANAPPPSSASTPPPFDAHALPPPPRRALTADHHRRHARPRHRRDSRRRNTLKLPELQRPPPPPCASAPPSRLSPPLCS